MPSMAQYPMLTLEVVSKSEVSKSLLGVDAVYSQVKRDESQSPSTTGICADELILTKCFEDPMSIRMIRTYGEQLSHTRREMGNVCCCPSAKQWVFEAV